MPAPSNDNFASATSLSGASGSTTGTTASATTEASEPAHYNWNPAPAYPTTRTGIGPFNTVWYSWTCPADGDYYFSTRDTTGALGTDFRTAIQLFTGAAVGSLTPVTLLLDQGSGFGNGFDNGSIVAFRGSSGTTYKLQVDGRYSGDTGNFVLAWGAYVAERFGDCNGCPLDFQSEVCVGTVGITDVTVDDTYSFGTIDASAGYYKVKYCGGAFIDENGKYKVSGSTIYTGSISVWNYRTVYHAGDQVLSTNAAWNTAPTYNGVYVATGTSTLLNPVDNTTDWVDDYCPAPFATYHACGPWIPPDPNSDVHIYSPSLAYSSGSGAVVFTDTSYVFLGGTTYPQLGGGTAGIGPTDTDGVLCGNAYTNATTAVAAYQPGFGGPWSAAGTSFLPNTEYNTASQAEAANLCSQSGRLEISASVDIGLAFPTRWIRGSVTLDTGVTPNHINIPRVSSYQNGTRNPQFQLIYNPFTIDMLDNASGFTVNGSGTSWTFHFLITNLTAIDWSNCTIELLATGGITSPSSAITGVDLAASSTTDSGAFTCTADPTAGLVTATIRITRNNVVVGTIDYPVYPIFVVTVTQNVTQRTCSGYTLWGQNVLATKVWPPTNMDEWGGSWASAPIDSATGHPSHNQLTAALTVAVGTPQMYCYISSDMACVACATASSLSKVEIGTYSSFHGWPGFQPTGSAYSVGLQMTFDWKVSDSVTLTLPTWTQTITVHA